MDVPSTNCCEYVGVGVDGEGCWIGGGYDSGMSASAYSTCSHPAVNQCPPRITPTPAPPSPLPPDRQIDPGFDQAEFVDDMAHVIVPTVVEAFLRGDRGTLQGWCSPSAMAHINAVFRAREAEGAVQDPTVLSISRVEMVTAKAPERGPPVAVCSAMVQQINCIRNAKGEVIEGNEDEIRAVMYVFAMHRGWDEAGLGLSWKVSEMSMFGSQLYL
jgi:predicted lipid-binding transport protein (Tim44 family)